jgi:hypothetical protein
MAGVRYGAEPGIAIALLSVPFQNPAGVAALVTADARVLAAPADPADIATPSPAQAAITAAPAIGVVFSFRRLKNLVIGICRLPSRRPEPNWTPCQNTSTLDPVWSAHALATAG